MHSFLPTTAIATALALSFSTAVAASDSPKPETCSNHLAEIEAGDTINADIITNLSEACDFERLMTSAHSYPHDSSTTIVASFTLHGDPDQEDWMLIRTNVHTTNDGDDIQTTHELTAHGIFYTFNPTGHALDTPHEFSFGLCEDHSSINFPLDNKAVFKGWSSENAFEIYESRPNARNHRLPGQEGFLFTVDADYTPFNRRCRIGDRLYGVEVATSQETLSPG